MMAHNTITQMLAQAAMRNPEARIALQAQTLDAPKMSKEQLAKSYKAASVLLAKATAILEA